jgi:hypothetical protein
VTRSGVVPTNELAAARESAGAMFPQARVVALWTPASAQSDICVEIWVDRRAVVVPWANGAPAR